MLVAGAPATLIRSGLGARTRLRQTDGMPTAGAGAALGEFFSTPGHPDPYRLYRELHAVGPVHDSGYVQVAVSYELCNTVLRDRRLVIWDQWPTGQAHFAESACLQSAARALVYRDPPDHGRLRAMIGRAFSPQRIAGLRTYVRSFVNDRLDEAAESGTIDLISDLAGPLPLDVVGELLGVPPEDRAMCHDWTAAIVPLLGNPGATAEQTRIADQATTEFESYLLALAAERRTRPREDLISELVAMDSWTSEAEMVSNLNSLTAGGFETTIFSIGNAMLALLENPDQLQLLRRDPSLIETATEELLRYDSPLQFTTPRTAREHIDLGELTLPQGGSILPLLGAANRDPAHVIEPDRLDIRRPDARPLSFGAGRHHCVGAALAKIEIEEALSSLVQRFPRIELSDEPLERVNSIAFRGLKRMPLTV